jgi:Mn2+/Fe2+ NRAMP family transporter
LTDGFPPANHRAVAAVVGFGFLAIAAVAMYGARFNLAAGAGGIGATLLLLALFAPAWAARVGQAWARFGALLGFVNSRILLAAFFFLIVTPIGLIRRCFGKDPLNRRSGRSETYWRRREPVVHSMEPFRHLF